MRRIAAKYLYVNADFTPIHDGFVELDDNGVVLKTGKSEDISSEKEYYDGAVVCECALPSGTFFHEGKIQKRHRHGRIYRPDQ